MGTDWVGTRWRSVSVKFRASDGTIYPGDDFTFTQEMADKGCVPDLWILAGNAMFIPDGATLPPAPKDDDAPPAEADVEPVAPVRRKGKRGALDVTRYDDPEVVEVTSETDGSEVPGDGYSWAQ